MEAFILSENDDTETLQKKEVSVPTIADDEVLLKTEAIGINPIDAQVRASEDILNMIS